MKLTIGVLGASTIILGILYATIGGPILFVALATIALTTISLGFFGVGIGYAHKSIQLGVKLAAEAQGDKMESLAQFGGEIFKLKSQNAERLPPLLESGAGADNDTFDASFVIHGIDE